MKLATCKDGSRDGQLVVVSRDLTQAVFANGIATRMQQVLDDWNFLSPQLQGPVRPAQQGPGPQRLRLRGPREVHGPLPRAYQWADGSAFINHVELVRRPATRKCPPRSTPTP